MDLFEEMRLMQRDMDRVFGSLFAGPTRLLPAKGGAAGVPMRRPDTDIQETEREVIATFDLPGVEKGDISLSVDSNSVTVKAEKKQEKEVQKKGYYYQERAYGSYYRTLPLPAEVIPDQAEAEYKNGVLTVRMPKKEISVQKRKGIEVKVK